MTWITFFISLLLGVIAFVIFAVELLQASAKYSEGEDKGCLTGNTWSIRLLSKERE